MTLRWDDRCKVTATAPGTGAIPAASPAAAGGFIQISAITGIVNSDTVPYTITDGATLFETGYGTWNSVTGLTRTTVKSNSSRNTSAINFTGAVTVFCDANAASLVLADASGNVIVPGTLQAGGYDVTPGIAVLANLNGTNQTTGLVSNSINLVKLSHAAEDTAGWFDAVNFRYTPQKAGLYFFAGAGAYNFSSASDDTVQAFIFKNGAIGLGGSYPAVTGATSGAASNVSGLVRMNGSTDYVDLRLYGGSNISSVRGGINNTYLSGFRVAD